ncbi:MAG: hypothetical protein NC489_45435 [Ruminococcus flavefaciens]|nr:hypothetical protein [Ruminococcus flavefaciens]
MPLSTLHDIAIAKATRQPGMADALTEDAPILKVVKWKEASHGLWHVAEDLTEIKGAAFVEPDAPLPYMHTHSDLVHTDLHILGGTIEVPTQKAMKLGGPARYFADLQNFILRQAGMDTERQLVLRNWLRGAIARGNVKRAGATGKGWFVLAVRFDEHMNCGLYDPDQFDSGRLLKISAPYNGSEHYLHGPDVKGVLGYSVNYRGNFGWQLLHPEVTCSAVVNIDETHAPTVAMIDDILADVRAQPGSTYIFCSPRAKTYAINPHKVEHVRLAVEDKGMKTHVEVWNDISIITSHNFNEKIANVK